MMNRKQQLITFPCVHCLVLLGGKGQVFGGGDVRAQSVGTAEHSVCLHTNSEESKCPGQ